MAVAIDKVEVLTQPPVVSREFNGLLLLLRQPAAVFCCLHTASTAMQGLV